MDVIPGRFSLLAFERLFGVVAGLDERPVDLLHHDAVRFENRPFVLAREIRDQALALGIDRHYDILENVAFALHEPDRSRDRCGHFHRLHFVPTLQTAVRFYREIQ